MTSRIWTFLLVTIATASFAAVDASAQVLGTFRWRTEPYCNVLNVTVTQNGGVFTLDGFDEPCGGNPRLPVHGVAVPQPDGSVTLGVNVISVPGGAPLSLEAAISPATVSGTWRDSAGWSGNLSFNPPNTSGSPRPLQMAGSVAAWGVVNGVDLRFLAKSANVVSVTRPANTGAGSWCIGFSQPIPQERRVGAVATAADEQALVVNGTHSDVFCPDGIHIYAFSVNNNQLANTLFTFIVP